MRKKKTAVRPFGCGSPRRELLIHPVRLADVSIEQRIAVGK